MRILTGFLFFFLLQGMLAYAQTTGSIDPVKEDILKARTKQVTQFIRRFNGEEGPEGNPYDRNDSRYHNPRQRMKFMPYLFDKQTSNYPVELRKKFQQDVVLDETPQFLDFREDGWFAEVNASFSYKGEKTDALLFLELEKEAKGYKWVLANVYFSPFHRKFANDTSARGIFLHPMSHEVDFMNLKEVFAKPEAIEHYAAAGYQPDFLTLFFYELKKENLHFRHVKQVKFHFLQAKGWYFELSYIERKGRNAGWLITNLLEVSEKQKKDLKALIQLKQ